MQENLQRTRGLIVAEAVAMGLAQHLGRDKAHHLVEEASREAIERGCDLGLVLAEHGTVLGCLSREELERLLDPTQYVGANDRMISAVLSAYAETKKAGD